LAAGLFRDRELAGKRKPSKPVLLQRLIKIEILFIKGNK